MATTGDMMKIDSTNAEDHQGGFVGTGGFYIRQFWHLPDSPYQGHAHWIDHVGNLVSGKVRVHWRDPDTDESGTIEMLVPSKIHMPAKREHRIEAIVPSLWECWFSKDEADRIYGSDATTNWTLEK